MAYNFSITQGSELNTRLTITNDGSAVNLSGYAVRGVVKHKYGDSNALIDLNPTIVTGEEGAGLQSGLVDIYLSGSQTAALPVAEAVYDIERFVTGSEGQETAVIKMLNGKFTVSPEVTT